MELLTRRISSAPSFPPHPAAPRDMLAAFHPQAPASHSVGPAQTEHRNTTGGRQTKKPRGGRESEQSAPVSPRFARNKEERNKGAGAPLKVQNQRNAVEGTAKAGERSSGSAAGKGRETRSVDQRTSNRHQRRWNKSMQANGSSGGNPGGGGGGGAGGSGDGGGGGRGGGGGGGNWKRHRKPAITDKSSEERGKPRQPPAPLPPDTTEHSNKSNSLQEEIKQGGKKGKSEKPSPSRSISLADSGKGEDLSSSCESSVFEPQVLGNLSHSSSSSSLDEFHDALSNIPSASSSTFVTPLTTRSHSPVCLHGDATDGLHGDAPQPQSSLLSESSSLEQLRSSLLHLSQCCHGNSTEESTDDHVTSENSHMTSENGHMTPGNGHTTSEKDRMTSTNGHVTSENGHVTSEKGHMTTENCHVTVGELKAVSRESCASTGRDHMTSGGGHMTVAPQECDVEMKTRKRRGSSQATQSRRKTLQLTSIGEEKSSVGRGGRGRGRGGGGGGRRGAQSVCGPRGSQVPKCVAEPDKRLGPSHTDGAVVSHANLRLSSSERQREEDEKSGRRGKREEEVAARGGKEQYDSSPSPQPPSPSTGSPSPSTPSQPSPSPSPGPLVAVAKQTVRPSSDDPPLASGAPPEGESPPHPQTEPHAADEWPDLDSIASSRVKGHSVALPTQSVPVAYPPLVPIQFQWCRPTLPPPGPPQCPHAFPFYNGYHLVTPPTGQTNLSSFYPPFMLPPTPYLPYFNGPPSNGPPNTTPPGAPYNPPIQLAYCPPETETTPTNTCIAPPTTPPDTTPTTPPETTPTTAGIIPPTPSEALLISDVAPPTPSEAPPTSGAGQPASNAAPPTSDVALPTSDVAPPTPVPPLVLAEAHPLSITWVMWYDKITGNSRTSRSDYRKSLKCLNLVSSVEDFWRLFNNIHLPSQLDKNSNYHFFREGIEPTWEDSANKQGGKWVLTLKDSESVLNKVWEEMLMGLIGGYINHFDVVNGVVVSRRKKGDRIALWTRKKSTEINLDICTDLLKALMLACDISLDNLGDFIHQLAEGKGGVSLSYMHHSDSMVSGTSYQNSSHISLKEHAKALVGKTQQSLVK